MKQLSDRHGQREQSVEGIRQLVNRDGLPPVERFHRIYGELGTAVVVKYGRGWYEFAICRGQKFTQDATWRGPYETWVAADRLARAAIGFRPQKKTDRERFVR